LGRIFLGDKILKENFIMGGLTRIPKQNPFYFKFLFVSPTLRVEMLRVIVRDKFLTVLNCLDDFSGERNNFSVELYFLALKKKHLE